MWLDFALQLSFILFCVVFLSWYFKSCIKRSKERSQHLDDMFKQITAEKKELARMQQIKDFNNGKLKLTYRKANDQDFSTFNELGTDGSMPGPDALRLLKERHDAGDLVVAFFASLDEPVGLLSLNVASVSEAHYVVSTTYVRGEFYSFDLSRFLKNTSWVAAYSKELSYCVPVSPSNEKAIFSMSQIWPEEMTGIEIFDDSTLGYIPLGIPHGEYDEKLAKLFMSNIQTKEDA